MPVIDGLGRPSYREFMRLLSIRSLVGSPGVHNVCQVLTGWKIEDLRSLGGRPAINSVVAKLLGPVDRSVPPAQCCRKQLAATSGLPRAHIPATGRFRSRNRT